MPFPVLTNGRHRTVECAGVLVSTGFWNKIRFPEKVPHYAKSPELRSRSTFSAITLLWSGAKARKCSSKYPDINACLDPDSHSYPLENDEIKQTQK
jgi:hypothetical protein